MFSFAFAQPNASGPIKIPSTISSTTVGRTRWWWNRERIAAAAAAPRTQTSDPGSWVVASAASGKSPLTRSRASAPRCR